MINKFKAKLRANGQSMAWFWRTHLKRKITYGNFRQQINGYSKMFESVEAEIMKFIIPKKGNDDE